jgi:hypothetical protein
MAPNVNAPIGGGPVIGVGGGMGMTEPRARWVPAIHPDKYVLKKQAEEVFKMFDRDQNGQLMGQEFYAAFARLCQHIGCPPPSQKDISYIAANFDANRNGIISLKEFKLMAKDLFGYDTHKNPLVRDRYY